VNIINRTAQIILDLFDKQNIHDGFINLRDITNSLTNVNDKEFNQKREVIAIYLFWYIFNKIFF